MPATPAINWIQYNAATGNVNINVTAGADTTHIQFDRSWVDNGGGTNDREEYCPTGTTITVSFVAPSSPGYYTIMVRARINSTASSWVSRGFEVVPPPDPDPYVSGLTMNAHNFIEVYIGIGNSAYARDSNGIAIYLSGPNNSTQHFQTYLHKSTTYWTKGTDGAGAALQVGATYRVWVYVYDKDNNSFGANTSKVFSKPKPAQFSFTYTKTSNGQYNLLPAEWSGLLDRINDWRAYFGLVTRDFNKTITPGAINTYVVPSATSFTAARNALSDMSPPTSPPSSVSSGQLVTASLLNTMLNSANSLTNK